MWRQAKHQAKLARYLELPRYKKQYLLQTEVPFRSSSFDQISGQLRADRKHPERSRPRSTARIANHQPRYRSATFPTKDQYSPPTFTDECAVTKRWLGDSPRQARFGAQTPRKNSPSRRIVRPLGRTGDTFCSIRRVFERHAFHPHRIWTKRTSRFTRDPITGHIQASMVHDAKISLVNHPHIHLDLKQLGRKLAERSRESTTMFWPPTIARLGFAAQVFAFGSPSRTTEAFLCFLEFGTWWLFRFESREF